jgi:serine/threonine protein kinase
MSATAAGCSSQSYAADHHHHAPCCSSARDLETNEKVAIKKISNCFDSPVDAKRILREVALLRSLRHENVVALRDVLPPPPPGHTRAPAAATVAGSSSLTPPSAGAGAVGQAPELRDVYLVYELMDTDLHQIIRSPQPLSDEHARYFTYQACVVAAAAVVVVVVVDEVVNHCADVDAC